MASPRTLAVDIGGTGVKLALLDDKGRIIGKSLRVPTPMPPVAPEALAAAIDRKGHKTWNKRVERAIGILRRVVNFDHLYLGGGNAKHIPFPLPSDVTIVPNTDGLTGGIALWRGEAETSSPLRKRSKTAKRKNARPRT